MRFTYKPVMLVVMLFFLFPACSKDTGVPDAGNPDADGGIDMDPCELAIPEWE
jgi:hypothetical protein